MQAQILNRGLEEGKAVLYNHDTAKANLESMSIARELEGLSDSQVTNSKYLFILRTGMLFVIRLKLVHNLIAYQSRFVVYFLFAQVNSKTKSQLCF